MSYESYLKYDDKIVLQRIQFVNQNYNKKILIAVNFVT